MSAIPKAQKQALRAKDEAQLAYKWLRRLFALTVLVYVGFIGAFIGALASHSVSPGNESRVFTLIFIALIFMGAFGLTRLMVEVILPAYRRLRAANYAYQDCLDEYGSA